MRVYTYYADGSALNSWYENEYDENGFLVRSVGYNYEDVITGVSEYDCDSYGNVITRYLYEMTSDPNGEYAGRYEYEYDSYGNNIRFTSYDADGNICAILENEYDENGNCIQSARVGTNGGLISGEAYEYDDHGYTIADYGLELDWSIGPEMHWYENEYDASGNIIRRVTHSLHYNMSDPIITEYEYTY